MQVTAPTNRNQRILIIVGALAAVGLGFAASPVAPTSTLFFAYAAVLGAVFILILVTRMEIALLVLIAGRASIDLVADMKLGPLNIAAVLALLVIIAGILYWIDSGSFIEPQSPVFPFLLFLIVTAVGLISAPDLLGALKDWLRLASLMVIFVLVAQFADSERGLRRFGLAIAASAVLPVLYGFYQFATGQGFDIKQGSFLRITGTFLHPNPFAIYLALILPLVIALALTLRRWRVPLVLLGCAMTIALVLTFTRTAWIGLGTALLVMGFLRYRSILLLAPVVLVAAVLFVPSIGERFSDVTGAEGRTAVEQENSLDWRVQYWRLAADDVKASPIWGQGLDSITASTDEGKQAHNDFVRILVETGLLGFVFFVWWIARFLRLSFVRAREPASPLRHAVRVAFAATCTAYIVMSVTSNLISQPALQWYFWAFAALALTVASGSEGAESDAESEPERELVSA